MSDAVETYGQFGQTLALAEATLHNILERHLAARGITPERWYALKLTAQAEPIARAAVIDGLAAGGKVKPADAGPLLRGLQDDGLVMGSDLLSLTEAGHGYFTELRQYVIAPTIQLLSQFELADIQTTLRTLREIAAQANKELASAAG